MRTVVIIVLTLVTSCRGDYPCLCNYAIDTPIYRRNDKSSTVINHMSEFSCSPIYNGTVNSDSRWLVVVKENQIGYVELSPNVLQQSCAGHPDPVDTVTTGLTTPSTTTSATSLTTSTRTTSSTSSIQTTTLKENVTSLSTDSLTSVSVPLSTNPTTSMPSQTSTIKMATYKPTEVSTKSLTPSTTTKTTTSTIQRPTAHQTVTQTHHLPTFQYHCPPNVLSAAQYNNGYATVHGNSCYELVPAKATWQYAEQNCRHKGGHLVHMSNPDDEKFVMQFLWSHNYNHAVWIGLNDIGHEEHFTWSSGDSFVYSKWTPGRKSNFVHHYFENCVALAPFLHAGFLQTYGQWDDVNCGHHYPWICRYDPHTSQSSYHSRTTTLAPVIEILSHIFGR